LTCLLCLSVCLSSTEAKLKVTKETEAAIAVMEKESEGLLKSLDAQVGAGRLHIPAGTFLHM
jgi:hypothetical protein